MGFVRDLGKGVGELGWNGAVTEFECAKDSGAHRSDFALGDALGDAFVSAPLDESFGECHGVWSQRRALQGVDPLEEERFVDVSVHYVA